MPILTWSTDADLLTLTLTVQPQTDLQFPTHYTTELHSWFLNQVRLTDPDLSAYLHDGESEKAFAISPLTGNIQTQDRELFLSKHDLYQWSISALTGSLCTWMQQWLSHPPKTMKLRSGTFSIEQWQIQNPALIYETVWEQAETAQPLSLTFTTPTSFRKRGNHMPLPIPENIFHSYLRRWNSFSHLEFEQGEFLEWVNEYVVILRHEIRSQKTQAGKQGSVTGFVGSVQFGLTPKAQAEPEYVQLVHALIICAPYFGTGHKVTFGLGQTQLGWHSSEVLQPVETIETNRDRSVARQSKIRDRKAQKSEISDRKAQQSGISDRLVAQLPEISEREARCKQRKAELKQFFFNRKKRQGGERAEKAAEMWAEIIARQESGASLPEIATALELSYDTVKQYAKRARKVMEEESVHPCS